LQLAKLKTGCTTRPGRKFEQIVIGGSDPTDFLVALHHNAYKILYRAMVEVNEEAGRQGTVRADPTRELARSG
jgi:hypothetical protein